MPNPTTDADVLKTAREAAILVAEEKGFPDIAGLIRSGHDDDIVAVQSALRAIALDRAAQTAARETAAPVGWVYNWEELDGVVEQHFTSADYPAPDAAGNICISNVVPVYAAPPSAARETAAPVDDVFGDFDAKDYKPDLASCVAAKIMGLKWTHGAGADEHCYRYGDVQEAVSRVLVETRTKPHSVYLAAHPAQATIPEMPVSGDVGADTSQAEMEERARERLQYNRSPCSNMGSTGYDLSCSTCKQYTDDFERKPFECPFSEVDIAILKTTPAPDQTLTTHSTVDTVDRGAGVMAAAIWDADNTSRFAEQDAEYQHEALERVAVIRGWMRRQGFDVLPISAPDQTPPRGDVTVEEIVGIVQKHLSFGEVTEYGRAPKLRIHGLSEAAEAILATLSRQSAGAERVRHVKRGTEYEVLGEAEAQVSYDLIGAAHRVGRPLWDENRLTVYRCVTTGKLWCRLTDEFSDGRFVPAPPETPPAGSPQVETGGPV